MEPFAELIRYAVIAAFSFFVVAPCVLSAISLFGVQKRFAAEMIEKEIVPAEEVERLHPKKQIAGVIFSCVVVGALVAICMPAASLGYCCGGVSLLAGLWRYRTIVQYNSLTVQRFKNSYRVCMDDKKYNQYVKEHFPG